MFIYNNKAFDFLICMGIYIYIWWGFVYFLISPHAYINTSAKDPNPINMT
jgi:hypothetical protein